MMALAIAIVAVATTSPKAKASSKAFQTVYWYYVNNATPLAANQPQSSATVDNTINPIPGATDETFVPTGCGDTDFYCAKGFTASEVNSTTHRPANPNSPATFLSYKD